MRWRIFVVGLAVVGVAACDLFPTAPGAFASARAPRESVTGAAAAAWRDGQLVLPPPPYQFMSPARADSMAFAIDEFFRRLLGDVATGWMSDEGHDGPVQLYGLRRCGRDYWVQSPVVAPEEPDANFMAYFGPRYVVPLCSRDARAQILADVGDRPDHSIIRDGTFAPPWSNGNEIDAYPVPDVSDHGIPTSPELAIGFVHRITGARVDQLPTALANYPSHVLGHYPAQCMRWHLHLDRDVILIGSSGARYVTRDVYVSRLPVCVRGDLAIQVPIAPQPTSVVLVYHVRPSGAPADTPPETDTVRVPVVAPVYFEAATVAR